MGVERGERNYTMRLLPDFDFGHGETIGQLRDSVASFCANELAPRAAEIDRDNEFLGIYGLGWVISACWV